MNLSDVLRTMAAGFWIGVVITVWTAVLIARKGRL
jgi:tetrahydromethanopterin S-methyltransferase subunit B